MIKVESEKRLFIDSVIIILSLVAFVALGVSIVSLNTVDNFHKQSVKKIISGEGSGTGFYFKHKDSNRLITNRHVVFDSVNCEDNSKCEYPSKKIHVLSKGEADGAKVEFSCYDMDLAILKTYKRGKPIKLSKRKNRIRNKLTIPNYTFGNYFYSEGKVLTDSSPYAGFKKKLFNVFRFSGALSGGSSGSPVLNTRGKLVGVTVAENSRDPSINLAIDLTSVKEFLRRYESEFEHSKCIRYTK